MGIINWAGGLSQGAAAMGDFFGKAGLETIKSQLEEAKLKLADELSGKREIAKEERAIANVPRLQDATLPGLLKEKRGLSDIDIERATREATEVDPIRQRNTVETARLSAQARIDTEYSEDNIQKKIDAAKRLGPAEAQIKLDAEMASLAAKSSPASLKALNAIARASQVLTPGQVAEADIKKLELSRKQLLDEMQSNYAAAVKSGDTKAANGIVQAITARFFDPEKLKDQPELKAAQSIIQSMDASPSDKEAAAKFIMDALKNTSAKMGASQGVTEPSAGDISGLIARAKDPRAIALFESRYGAGSAAKYLPVTKEEKQKSGKTKPLYGSGISGVGPVPGSVAWKLQNPGLISAPLEDDERQLNPN